MNESQFSDPADGAIAGATDFNNLYKSTDRSIYDSTDISGFFDTTADYVLENFSLSQFKSVKDWAEAIAAWHDAAIEVADESARSETLKRVIGELLEKVGGDLRIRIYALGFSIGANRLSKCSTLSEAAELLGCTRAALSKAQIEWEKMLSLGRSVHTKSEENKKTFSEVQKTRHWRRMNRNNPVSFPIPDPTPGWEL